MAHHDISLRFRTWSLSGVADIEQRCTHFTPRNDETLSGLNFLIGTLPPFNRPIGSASVTNKHTHPSGTPAMRIPSMRRSRPARYVGLSLFE